jgi:hypothetical protein
MEQNLAWEANSFWPSQEISHVHPIRWFITLFTRPWHSSLSSARSIQSTSPILFLEDPFYHFPSIGACGFPVVFIPQVSLTKPLYTSIFALTCNILMSDMDVQMWGILRLCAVCILMTPIWNIWSILTKFCINLCDWKTPKLRNRRLFFADAHTLWQNTAGS